MAGILHQQTDAVLTILDVHCVTPASSGFSEATVFTTTVVLLRLPLAEWCSFVSAYLRHLSVHLNPYCHIPPTKKPA